MSDKITNITELCEHALGTLEKLSKKQIEVAEAGVTGKLYETVISSLKLQLVYAEMRDEEPNIDFIESGKGKAVRRTTIDYVPQKQIGGSADRKVVARQKPAPAASKSKGR